MVICYEINMANGVAELPVWSKIWKAQIHERLKVFIGDYVQVISQLMILSIEDWEERSLYVLYV